MLMQNFGVTTKSIMVCYGISGAVNYDCALQLATTRKSLSMFHLLNIRDDFH